MEGAVSEERLDIVTSPSDRFVIFYSWQSDLPNETNRILIETAMEEAIKSIKADKSIAVEPVIDRDTGGVAGSPDIASTIFEKIHNADGFVADVSIITNRTESRAAPNPNVLIELGFAINQLGWNRIVMVMNDCFGRPEALPFDLRQHLVTTYSTTPEDPNCSTAKNVLRDKLEQAIRSVLLGGPVRSNQIIDPSADATEIAQRRQFHFVLLNDARKDLIKAIKAEQEWALRVTKALWKTQFAGTTEKLGHTVNWRDVRAQVHAAVHENHDSLLTVFEEHENLFPETTVCRGQISKHGSMVIMAVSELMDLIMKREERALGLARLTHVEQMCNDLTFILEDVRVHILNRTVGDFVGHVIPARVGRDQERPRMLVGADGKLRLHDHQGRIVTEIGRPRDVR
jgi:hypothetical protein